MIKEVIARVECTEWKQIQTEKEVNYKILFDSCTQEKIQLGEELDKLKKGLD